MFSNWLIQQDRLERDPTLGLEKLNEEEDRRLVRRALSDEEAEWLIDTTLKSEGTFRGQTGEARALLYVVGLRTGFRRGELLSLTPQSFRLFGTNPMVKAAAKATKNRKQAEQPLPADLAAWIADYTRGLPPDAPVWPHKNLGWWHRTAEMVRHDLQAARQAWLDDSPTSAVRSAREKTDFLKYRDADGQQVDFHGHRHTFVTTLARHGVPTSSIQYLARHSDYKTTQRYVHTALGDVAGFVDQLPELGPRRPADVIRATGTNDASPGSERRADHGADQTFRTDRRGGLNGANGDRGKIATRSRPRNPKTPGTKGVAGLDGEQIDTLEAEGTGLEPARPCGPSDFEADANAETQCRKELTAQGLRVVTEEEVPSADHGADQSLAEAAAKPASRKMLEDMLARRRPGSKQLAAMLEEMGVPPAERKAVLTLVAGAVKRRKAKPRQKAAGA
jgi:integrase